MKRRDFLTKTAILGGATSLAIACGPAAAPSGASAPAGQAIKRGGILKWQNSGTPTIDITQNTAGANVWALQLIYDRLIGFRANTFTDPTPAPSLAEKWEVSADGKKVTLSLRKGVMWQNIAPVNGREFTSADVAWNVNHYKTKTVLKYLYDSVDSVETPDKYTAVLVLKAPAVQVIAALGDKHNYMYAREVFEQKGNFHDLAIGTGPFELKSFEPNVSVVLRARKDYWQMGADGKPLPYIDGVESYTVADYNARVAGIRSGQYDEIFTAFGANKPEADEFKKAGLVVTETVDSFSRALHLNMTNPLLQDVRVRRAINFALDRPAYIQTILSGDALPGSWVPIEGWGWDAAKIQQKLARNVPEARRLLTEAGKMGAKLVINTYRTGAPGQNDKAGQFIGENLKEAGFAIEHDIVADFPTFSATKINTSTFQVMPLVISDGADVENHLFRLHSAEPASSNRGRIKDPKLDAMIERQRTLANVDERKKQIAEIEDYLYEQMYVPPMPTRLLYKVRQPWVQMNGAADHLAGIWRPERIWINK